MESLQFGCLFTFAIFAVLSFIMRLRVGMIQGEIDRNAKTKEQAQEGLTKNQKGAMTCAIIAGVSLVVCMILGAITKLGA